MNMTRATSLIQPSTTIWGRLTGPEFLVFMALLVALGLITATEFFRGAEVRRLRACQTNLKEIGLALSMYAVEAAEGQYPPAKINDCRGNVQPWSGAMDLTGVCPEYLTDLDLFVCPFYGPGRTAVELWDEGKTTNPRWEAITGFSHDGVVEPCEVLAKPYYYYGWAFAEMLFQSAVRYELLEPEDNAYHQQKRRGLAVTVQFDPTIHYERFRQATLTLAERMAEGSCDSNLPMWELEYYPGKKCTLPGTSEIPALREGAERYYFNEIGSPWTAQPLRAKIVFLHEELFDRPGEFYHGKGRINVLYMDGHVECLRGEERWNDPFPLNEAGQILHDAVEGTLTRPSD